MTAVLTASGVFQIACFAVEFAANLGPASSLSLLSLVLGVGLLLAARDPYRLWPVVLMALLANAGAIVILLPAPGWISRSIMLGSSLWIMPFGAILFSAYRHLLDRKRTVAPEVLKISLHRKTQFGVTLDDLSRLSPTLVVFLRHFGCAFCREALTDLAAARTDVERQGVRLVLVHMGTEEQGARFFRKYGLDHVPRISDPERALYRAFGLPRGTLGDVFGPKVWLRFLQASILDRHGAGRSASDGFQMPGAFLLFHGAIVRSYRHQSAADRPDYLALVTGRDYAAPELRS